jgi:hypothetical protein
VQGFEGRWAPPTLRPVPAGRVEAPVLVRAAHRAGHLLGPGPAADAERYLRPHHQALPVLQDRRQGLAGERESQPCHATGMVRGDVGCLPGRPWRLSALASKTAFVFDLVALGFELRALQLLGRRSASPVLSLFPRCSFLLCFVKRGDGFYRVGLGEEKPLCPGLPLPGTVPVQPRSRHLRCCIQTGVAGVPCWT